MRIFVCFHAFSCVCWKIMPRKWRKNVLFENRTVFLKTEWFLQKPVGFLSVFSDMACLKPA